MADAPDKRLREVMAAFVVIGECMPRHRAREFIRFLKKIDRAAAALASREGVELVRIARRASPSHSFLGNFFFLRENFGLGRGIDCQGWHDPAALRYRTNIARWCSGCVGSCRGHTGKPYHSHRQGL
jgi:hypothetical protein